MTFNINDTLHNGTVMLSVAMVSVVMLNVNMLSVVKLNVILLSVMVPFLPP